jgi:hypothetical protein
VLWVSLPTLLAFFIFVAFAAMSSPVARRQAYHTVHTYTSTRTTRHDPHNPNARFEAAPLARLPCESLVSVDTTKLT